MNRLPGSAGNPLPATPEAAAPWPPTPRQPALDALRGLAVLGMVFSGAIAYGGVLPAWMYHVQVPPPLHKFDPQIAGIGWVDLVFPFFLFCQGAALPLAAHATAASRAAGGGAAPWRDVCAQAARRAGLMAALAIFYFQLRPAAVPRFGVAADALLALLAFALLCAMLMRPPQPPRPHPRPRRAWVPVLAGLAALALLVGLPLLRGERFDPARSDIILVVLANMAFFGALIHRGTARRPWLALAVLPPVLAVHLAGAVPGSAAHAVLLATPLPWLYQFGFLKYLLIVVPGSLFGLWLLRAAAAPPATQAPRGAGPALAACCLATVVLCTTLLYTRAVGTALLASLALLGLAGLLARGQALALRRMLAASGWLLLLGLLLEPLQGGIRKDPATVSYHLVTAGLAGLSLLALLRLPALPGIRWCCDRLAEVGRNPLLGYTAGALLVAPLLTLSSLRPVWAGLTGSAAQGLMRGLLFTAAVATVTILFTRRGLTWKI